MADDQKPETNIGSELNEKVKMVRQANAALTPPTAPAPRDTTGAEPAKAQGPYGTRGKEKRLPWALDKANTKKAPVYHDGVDSVPETGPAILEKGEKVVPKEENPDNPDNEPDMDSDDKVHSPEEKAHFARSMHHLNAGGLHRHLGIPEGKPIPMAKKQEAANSDNPHVAAMGRMAVAMHGWKHPKKK